MNRREWLIGAGAAVGAGLSRFPDGWAAPAGAPKRSLLFFTKSSGFEHPAIKRTDGQLGHAERILTELGAQHGFEVTCTKDGSLFTPENLAKYDAFAFYTTGDLTTAGTDKNPPMTAAGKAALLDAIRNGKGFVGTHSATDTFHSEPLTEEARYVNHGEQVDPYVAMIGAEFIRHDKQQVAKMIVTDPKFPGFGDLGSGFELMEEWYSAQGLCAEPARAARAGDDGDGGKRLPRRPFPATWARMHGKGRVFYTSMGHREDVWTNPRFQSIFLGGIAWAVGNAMADVTPNLRRTAPRAAEPAPSERLGAESTARRWLRGPAGMRERVLSARVADAG